MESTLTPLTPREIKRYREWAASAIPYTDEEIEEIEFDGRVDMERYAAYVGKSNLELYGIPLVEESDEHE